MSRSDMVYFKPHLIKCSYEWEECSGSLQAVGPDAQSKLRPDLALCPHCDSMRFCAPKEEVLANLVEEVEHAKGLLAKNYDLLEVFRQRLSLFI